MALTFPYTLKDAAELNHWCQQSTTFEVMIGAFAVMIIIIAVLGVYIYTQRRETKK